MKRMRKSILTLGATIALTFGTFAPTNNIAKAATSCYDSYKFNETFSSVQETDYWALCKGKLKVKGTISGSEYYEPQGNRAVVTVQIYREQWGLDEFVDEFDVVLYDDEPGDFSYTVGKTDLANYYLKFKAKEYEGNGGKWTFKAKGTISTN